jgi:kynurenine formamidase
MPRRIVDLSYPIHTGMTTFPSHWHPMVEVSVMGRHGIENRETRKLLLGTHIGTHCDAPRHMIPGGDTMDSVPLDVFLGPALVLDLSGCRPRQQFEPGDLERKLADRRPERLLLRFDWSDYWGQMKFYTDYPFLSVEAGRWLVRRGVKLLGMDSPSPDNPDHGRTSDPDSPVHKVLLGAGVILLEYLCNLRELRQQEVELAFLPLKVREGDGAPGRAVAIERA